MNNPEITIQALLRWRMDKAAEEAPPAPRASTLLEAERPWWEAWPERFRELADRVGGMRVGLGHAMAALDDSGEGHPVPALVVRAIEELETTARLLFFSAREGRLRLRFKLEGLGGLTERAFEVTFLSVANLEPLFSAIASRSVDDEFRLDLPLTVEQAAIWKSLRVTDPMPFRLILRSETPLRSA